MVKILFLLFMIVTVSSSRYEFDIRFNTLYTPKVVYDTLLPFLIRYKITEKEDTVYTKLETVIRHINFYATPGLYERFEGLGTNGANFHNSSLMMASGNMLCSEQATLAVQSFSDQFEQSRLDLVNHTNGELFIDNRWVIVDPMFDMRIKNKEGMPASFDDIRHYINGKTTALTLPEKILPRTQKYLDLYKKEKFTASPTAPRITFFGNRHISPKQPTGINIGLHPVKMIDALKKEGINFKREFSPRYLAFYIIPNILYLLENSADAKQKADFIQDVLLGAMKKEFPKDIPLDRDLYLARQYQIMLRYEKALAIYEQLDQTEQVKFYRSQIYFERGETKAFDTFKEDLKENPFYKYMYYKLFNRFLEKTDKELLENFPFRHYNY